MDAMQFDDYRNPEFNASDVAAKFRFLMQTCFSRAAREGYSISDPDLAEIDAAAAAAQRIVAGSFAGMRAQAVARRANLEEFDGVEFVSLGEDCFSRTLATRWGLKKFARLGEKSAPFDLSVHRIGVATTLIARDFADYLDPADLVFNPQTDHCHHRRLGVQFNHETGPEFAADDFAPLIARYEARIAHFRSVMASDRPVALVFHGCRPHAAPLGGAIARLWDAIVARWGAGDKRLICINTWPHGAEIVPTEVTRPGIAVLDIHYPRPGYIWHAARFAFAEDGVAFEAKCAEFVRREARLLLPSRRASAA